MTAWLLGAAALLCAVRKGKGADAMARGVRRGMDTMINVLPPLFCMVVCVGALRASGLWDAWITLLAPCFSWLQIPDGALPILFLRPLTGSGALAVVRELMEVYGPDSPEAVSGAVLCASGDTVFYILMVYMGSSGASKSRYTVPCALFGWLLGAVTAGFVWPLGL